MSSNRCHALRLTTVVIGLGVAVLIGVATWRLFVGIPDEGWLAYRYWPVFEALAGMFGVVLAFQAGQPEALDRFQLSRRTVLLAVGLPCLALAVGLSLALSGGIGLALLGPGLLLLHLGLAVAEAGSDLGLGEDPSRRLRAAIRGAQVLAVGAASAAAAALLVFGPLITWEASPAAESRVPALMLIAGVCYFVIQAVGPLLGLDRWFARVLGQEAIEQHAEDLWRERAVFGWKDSVERYPRPTVGVGRIGRPELVAGPLGVKQLRVGAFEDWIGTFPVRRRTRQKIQYWDRKLVRFGTPFSLVRRRRRLGVAAVTFSLALGALFAFLSSQPPPDATRVSRDSYRLTVPKDHRSLYLGVAGLMGLLACGGLVVYFRNRKNVLPQPTAIVDGHNGVVMADSGVRESIRDCALVVEQAEQEGVPDSESWSIRARSVARKVISIPLVTGASHRDVVTIQQELLVFGFQEPESRPEPAAQSTADAEDDWAFLV